MRATRNFSVSEFQTSRIKVPEKYDRFAQFMLDTLQEFRDSVGKRIFIYAGYDRKGHTGKSAHYVGCAIDFNVVGWPVHKTTCEFLKKFEPDYWESGDPKDLKIFGVSIDGSSRLHIDCLMLYQAWQNSAGEKIYGNPRPAVWAYSNDLAKLKTIELLAAFKRKYGYCAEETDEIR